MTRDKVTELFPPGTIDATTRLVLANAVHLDAAWKFPFDPTRNHSTHAHVSGSCSSSRR